MPEIKVHEIRGKWPVYKVGDKIVINDPKISLDKTGALCAHVLSTLLHYFTILENDWCSGKRGVTTPQDPDHVYM